MSARRRVERTGGCAPRAPGGGSGAFLGVLAEHGGDVPLFGEGLGQRRNGGFGGEGRLRPTFERERHAEELQSAVVKFMFHTTAIIHELPERGKSGNLRRGSGDTRPSRPHFANF